MRSRGFSQTPLSRRFFFVRFHWLLCLCANRWGHKLYSRTRTRAGRGRRYELAHNAILRILEAHAAPRVLTNASLRCPCVAGSQRSPFCLIFSWTENTQNNKNNNTRARSLARSDFPWSAMVQPESWHWRHVLSCLVLVVDCYRQFVEFLNLPSFQCDDNLMGNKLRMSQVEFKRKNYWLIR